MIGLSVPSKVVGIINVPVSPAKLEFGCKAESSRCVPGGTVPAVILADSVRVIEVEMTDDINNLAVESDALDSMERPASCWFNCKFMISALAFNKETSVMPKVIVVDDELVALVVVPSWAKVQKLFNNSTQNSAINVSFLYI